MEIIIKALLMVSFIVGIIGFFSCWVIAYQKVENIEKMSQQAYALQPWWFLDSTLLPEESDHIRKKAIIYLILYLIPIVIYMVFNEA